MNTVTGSLQKKCGTWYTVIRMLTSKNSVRQKWKTTKIPVEGRNKRETAANEVKAYEILVHRMRDAEIERFLPEKVGRKFTDWIYAWLERKKEEVRINTYESYLLYAEKHILPFFEPMNLRIDYVTVHHLQAYVDNEAATGQSAQSIRKHMVILNGVFDEAVRYGIIPRNICDLVKMPRSKKFVGKAYDLNEVEALLKAIAGNPLEPAVMLALYLGLRRSEVLGLRWKDINFKENIIHICNTVVKERTMVESEQTKSEASHRDLVIPNALREYLLHLRAIQEHNRKLMGDSYKDFEHVCVWPDGHSMRPDYISSAFPKFLAKYHLPHIRFHELRHTAGSLLINAGVTPKAVQEMLGHEKVSTTLDIYTHLNVEKKRDVAEKMDFLLTGTKNKGCRSIPC